MVDKDNFKMLSNEEKSRYKYKFCELCEFYECELVREYTQFKENHIIISNTEEHHGSAIGLQRTATLLEDYEKEDVYVTSRHSGDEKNICDMLSYDQEKSCYIKKSEIINNQIECGNENVADGIGDHYKIEIDNDLKIKIDTEDRWEPSQPVFISAQTGSGKNYFVEKVLIPYLDELNYKKNTTYKILILSNRLALKRQIEERIKKNDDMDSADNWIYSFGDSTDVMTYQSLLDKTDYFKKRQNQKDSRYVFVICDEAHFFTSDAMFNPHTQKILSEIVKLFKDAVRVYMSATPYECLEYIVKTEKELNSHYKQMVFYHFKRDYSYLDINTYSDIKELYDEIVKSVSKGEKWLIFIDDKEKCKGVKTKLEEYGVNNECPMFTKKDNTDIPKIYAVDADSKEDKTYRSIIQNEKLGKYTYVLISTSVLDNGVNLEGIDNIVISDMSKVKSLQMVGRARTKKNGVIPCERKTLYIKRFDERYVKGRLDGFYKHRVAYRDYGAAYIGPEDMYPKSYNKYNFIIKYYEGDKEDWENAKHWFGRTPEKPDELYLNEISKSLLDKLILQYNFIYDEMKEESVLGNSGICVPGQKYLNYQLSWFGKKYSSGNDVTLAGKEQAQKELLKFLEHYANDNIHIVKEKQKAFSEEFTNLYDTAFQREEPNSDRIYGISKMKDLLAKRKIGYTIRSIGNPVRWVVEKVKKTE